MARNSNRRRTETEIPIPPETGRTISRRGTIQDVWWLVFGGCLTFLAFPYRTAPDSELWPLAWVGLAPLLWTLHGVSPKRGFVYGATIGFVINIGGFWWMSGMFEEFGHLPAVVAWTLTLLNALYQGMMFAVFGCVAVWLGRARGMLPGPLVLASTFTAIEYVYPMVFPWYLGNSQHPFSVFVQTADLTGVYGISFCVILGNALVASAAARVANRPIRVIQVAAAAVVLVGAVGYGTWRLGEVDAAAKSAPKLKIGMVEANIGIWEKEAKGLDSNQRRLTLHGNLLKHQEMSRELVRQGAELILWPESSYLPLGDVYGKRTDAFAIGVGQGDRLALWRDQGKDGFDWSLGPTFGGGGGLRAVAAAREDAVCAVGDHGRVIFWDGKRVRPVPVQALEEETATPALLGVAVGAQSGRADTDGREALLWAVGQHGHIYRGDPGGLDLIATGFNTTMRAVATVGNGRAVAVGDDGVIVALEGQGIRHIETTSDDSLYAVHFDHRTQRVWTAGANGTVLTAEPGGWSRERTGVETTLRSVATTPTGDVFVVGDAGTVLLRKPDGSWRHEAIGTKADMVSISLDARGTLLAADRQGSLWRRNPDAAAAWERLDAPGIGPLHSMAPLSYVRMSPIPKDTRYLYQSAAPGPDSKAYKRNPRDELAASQADRTAVQRGFTTPILFGAITWEPVQRSEGSSRARRVWNTAVLLDEVGRVLGMYDKYQLLAFGEYIPFGDWFPIVYDWIPEAGRFDAGDDVGAFMFRDHKLGLMICYEDILTRFAGRLANLEPDVLLNITNDAWFGRTSEPYLHLNLSIMRSIETHRSLLRSTNTGISTVIDPAGRLVKQTSLDDPETVLADVPMMKMETVYARIGDLFAHLTCLHLLGLYALRRQRRRA